MNTSTTSSTSTRRIEVRFSAALQINFVTPRSQMSEDEIASLNYTNPEWEQIQRDVVRTVRAMRQLGQNGGGQLNGEDMTERGLEHLSNPAVLRAQKDRKERVQDAVLDEQARQEANDINNAEDIAAASRLHGSNEAAQQALAMGTSDESFVRPELLRERAASSSAGARRGASAAGARRASLSMLLGRTGEDALPTTTEPPQHSAAARPGRRHSTVTVDDTPAVRVMSPALRNSARSVSLLVKPTVTAVAQSVTRSTSCPPTYQGGVEGGEE